MAIKIIPVFLRSVLLVIHVFLSQVADQSDMQTTDVSLSFKYTSLVSTIYLYYIPFNTCVKVNKYSNYESPLFIVFKNNQYKFEEGSWNSASSSSKQTF